MKTVIRIAIIIWIVILNLFILIPSYKLLFGQEADNASKLDEPPKPPAPPNTPVLSSTNNQTPDPKFVEEKVKSYTQEVTAYTQQVAAYNQQITAYKTRAELVTKIRGDAAYELVVKGTLQPLLLSLLTAFLAWVFANAGASLVDNYIRAKNNQSLLPLKFW